MSDNIEIRPKGSQWTREEILKYIQVVPGAPERALELLNEKGKLGEGYLSKAHDWLQAKGKLTGEHPKFVLNAIKKNTDILDVIVEAANVRLAEEAKNIK